MSEPPAPPRPGPDAIALTLLGCGLLVAAVVFAVPADDTSGLPGFYPNVLGEPGEELRTELIDALGVSVYTLLAGWVVLAIKRLCGTGWTRWTSAAIGWTLLSLSAAVAADRVGPSRLGGPLPGSGGSLGAALSLWLDAHFRPAGTYLILGACGLLSLTLAAERLITLAVRGTYFLIRTAWNGFRWVAVRLWRGAVWLPKAATRLTAPRARKQPGPAKETGQPAGIAAPKHGRPCESDIPIHHHEPAAGKADFEDEAGATRPEEIEALRLVHPAPEVPVPFELPALSLLEDPQPFPYEKHDEHLRDVAELLEKTFKDFGLIVRVVGIHTGPVITQYEIALETGLRVAKVTALADDLALSLKVPSVRIVAPLPGRSTVGVEVPNEHRAVVRLKELATAGAAKIAKSKLPLLLGKDSEGRALVYDLADMPHLLIAGRTGTGKSVCLNSIILSLLLTRRPDECRLLMIDPKQVELAEYAKLPHLMHPVVTKNEKAEAILAWAVDKMEERYDLLRRARVRNIASYNELTHDEILRRVRPADDAERERVPPRMPYIVIVVDEVGDLMMQMKKEVEGHIIRLAQKSRAAGIHLILTTQRPTVDVITGLIKSNLPARICFQVADRSNSRVVLDEMGAEKLLGKGDMLFLQPATSTIVRAQGTYASDDEISRVVGKLEVEDPSFDADLMNLREKDSSAETGGMMEHLRKRDELYEQAIEVVVREGRGSVSLLQRALGIGYGRAARLIDYMAEDGIVGHYNGAQAREVLFSPEQWQQMKSGGDDSLAESA